MKSNNLERAPRCQTVQGVLRKSPNLTTDTLAAPVASDRMQLSGNGEMVMDNFEKRLRDIKNKNEMRAARSETETREAAELLKSERDNAKARVIQLRIEVAEKRVNAFQAAIGWPTQNLSPSEAQNESCQAWEFRGRLKGTRDATVTIKVDYSQGNSLNCLVTTSPHIGAHQEWKTLSLAVPQEQLSEQFDKWLGERLADVMDRFTT